MIDTSLHSNAVTAIAATITATLGASIRVHPRYYKLTEDNTLFDALCVTGEGSAREIFAAFIRRLSIDEAIPARDVSSVPATVKEPNGHSYEIQIVRGQKSAAETIGGNDDNEFQTLLDTLRDGFATRSRQESFMASYGFYTGIPGADVIGEASMHGYNLHAAFLRVTVYELIGRYR